MKTTWLLSLGWMALTAGANAQQETGATRLAHMQIGHPNWHDTSSYVRNGQGVYTSREFFTLGHYHSPDNHEWWTVPAGMRAPDGVFVPILLVIDCTVHTSASVPFVTTFAGLERVTAAAQWFPLGEHFTLANTLCTPTT